MALLAFSSCALVNRPRRGGPEGEDAAVVDLATPPPGDFAYPSDLAGTADQGGDDQGSGDLPAADLASGSDLGGPRDWAVPVDLVRTEDLASPSDLARAVDSAKPADLAMAADLARPVDLAQGGGIIRGGPCASGAKGATAFRFRWVNGGGRATVQYEVNGLPDQARWKAAAYGYQIGFVPAFVDIPLGGGGLQLDGSSFVDVELSTAGVAAIRSATLSIYGRSYSVGSSGSFNWMTFTGAGAAPRDLVSNVAPYRWYSAEATAAFAPGDGKVLLRLKAGPSSGALAVAKMELCMEAN